MFWEPLRWIERVKALPLVQLKMNKKSISTGSALPSATPLNPSQMLQHSRVIINFSYPSCPE
jgi:hypothetical protein